MNKQGFWLKETIVYHTLIIDIRFNSHIRYLIKKHSAFQISKETIEKTYAKHHERPGFEGYAREELMTIALKKGWIRIRHHLSPHDHWIIQCDMLTERKPAIEQWIHWALENQIISDYQRVVLEDLRGERIEVDDLKAFREDASHYERKSRITVKGFMDELNTE